MTSKLMTDYLNNIAALTQRGDAREESYYEHLSRFLAQTAQAQGKTIQVTTLPKTTEAGNPDFRIWDGAYQVIGYVEAKAPGTNLDRAEDSAQLKRYRDTFPNLILTDFYEFRLYRQGVRTQTALLARPFVAQTLKAKPPLQQPEELEQLLTDFLDYTLPPSMTSEELSERLAHRTRFLRDQVVYPELVEQVKQESGDLYGFYQAFKRYLIADLSEAQFADLYAQTVTYGLFAARTRVRGTGTQNAFNRQTAFSLIPPTIGILRDLFLYISLGKPSLQMEVTIDDIAAVLSAVDVQTLLEEYYRQGRGDDPILHFYETFLAAYDPEAREQRGVYYTPQPVVGYIVRSVHHLLKTRFDLPDGLADERVTLLDPAAGTLTFPAEAIRLAFEAFVDKYGEGGKPTLLRKHILPHFYAFELLMAPYAIGHMKIGFLLEALGVPLPPDERFQLYLTNTLEMEDLEQTRIPGIASLSDESHKAAQIKKEQPILVILGNPPYSGLSANQNKWTERLLRTDLDGVQSYYTVDGTELGERNPKWLQDDYVKFLRFAQWKVHKAGRGIVAMITNHSYLDNPTFRGMRQSLLKTFDEIYILDLHGNSLKRERTPDGELDENVFDIRQGVAIAFLIKHGKDQPRGVYHNDLYGTRAEKYDWLDQHTLEEDPAELGYKLLEPCSPYYFLLPRQTHTLGDYLNWPRVNDIFPVNSVGIVTARDKLTIHWIPEEAWATVLSFSQMDEALARQAYQLGKDARDWKVALAQQDLRSDGGPTRDKIVPILYRPFDVRYTYYTGRSRGFHCRSRQEVMRHMLAGKNLGLITVRRCPPEGNPAYFFVSEHIISNGAIRSDNVSIDTFFPLYTYSISQAPSSTQRDKRPNLADRLVVALKKAYGDLPTPEEIMAYVYAVFYSPTYRQRYAEMLRVDFPRVPFTADRELFFEMAALGQQLIDLHLLRVSPDQPTVKYQGTGSDTIQFVRYNEDTEQVVINSDKYFEGITPAMWEYQIGGYQVLEKYLKDRRGRPMDDPKRYIQIARAVANTIALQQQIDLVYLQIESVGMLSQLSSPDRVQDALHRGVSEAALLSELALWDWMRREEDEAWAHLQQRPSS